MKKEEKELIYNLLKTAGRNIYGYDTLSFQNEISFQDDAPSFSAQTVEADEDIPLSTASPLSPGSTLEQKIQNCKRCSLSSGTSFGAGMGVKNPLVLVISDSLNFSKSSIQLLEKELISIQLSPEKNCFITGVVKCSAMGNRKPYQQEIDSCISFLDAQITQLKPKIIYCIGQMAAKYLLKFEDSWANLRSNQFEYKNVPMVVSHHPDELLRDAMLKRPAWEDLKKMKAMLLSIVPDYDK